MSNATKARRGKLENLLSSAVQAAKDDKFEESIGLLKRLVDIEDYRFKDLARSATKASEKVKKIASERQELADKAMQLVAPAIETNNHEQIIAILEQAPQKLISEDARVALRQARSFVSSQGSLSTEIKTAIEQRNWLLAGPLLDQLHQLEPEDKECISLSKKLSKKLLSKASSAFSERRYSLTIKTLDAIPSLGHNKEYNELRTRVENISWLQDQFDAEPFDTPTLGRLAVRLQKDEPDEPANVKRVQSISANLKQRERPPRTNFPYRSGNAKSWTGGELGYLSVLTSIKRPDLPELRPRWGQMNVAIGLALQGIGEGRIKTQMIQTKGLLGKVRQKKSNIAWGIDIGAHSIKVACLERSADEIQMIAGSVHEYEHPLCRPGYNEDAFTRAAETLQSVVEKHDIENAPVWINMPSNEVINRFTLFPPVNDKTAKQLIDQECKKRIPLDLEDLWLDSWVAPFDSNSTRGRAGIISAVKKSSIEERMEHFRLEGMNVVGMQADSLALANLVALEFAEELEAEVDDDEFTPTIAVVDCGAQTTSALLVSKDAHWTWNIEMGGEDLTGLLARELKDNRADAEKLKFNPHQLPSPAKNYSLIEDRLDEWKSRLTKLVDDAGQANPSFRITSIYGSGGGCLAHQWFRRVLMK